jgi:UDP-N-acetylmuramoylalanine--D-glutamate ligase
VSNALAAAAAAHAMGVGPADIRRGLTTFEPIEHRLEPVAEVAAVEWFNDSKATNPDAVFKAVEAFESRPIVLMLGGRNKGNDFRPLALFAAHRVRAVVAFGESCEEIAEAFADLGSVVQRADGLAKAVAVAATLACAGDAVLLSPACASFDEFDSYEHRGRIFKDLVSSLAGEA